MKKKLATITIYEADHGAVVKVNAEGRRKTIAMSAREVKFCKAMLPFIFEPR